MHTTGNINIFHNHRHTTGNTNNSSPQLHQRRRERETQRERERVRERERERVRKKETKRERETERENERGRKKEKKEREREREWDSRGTETMLHSREVLQDHPGWFKGDLHTGVHGGRPAQDVLHILLQHMKVVAVAHRRLQQHTHREWQFLCFRHHWTV